ncbi:MAG TPA: hypothetical protein PKD83_02280 [Ignavibacteria bacterium]|nr:hypothetical protein [Ignavibacteria bacterium]
MTKQKYPVKKKRANKSEEELHYFDNHYKPTKAVNILFYAAIILSSAALSGFMLISAYKLNNYLSFPLDDPWIHLTFAKNLTQYFSFSYFKDQIVTAGSTSPLYTFIVAIGFLITSKEMILSYFLGISFFVLGATAFYKLSLVEFNKEYFFALSCTGLFVADKWLNFISISGMETTMFILILVLTAYFYRTRNAVPFAVMLGLIMWTRPDGATFIIAIILDYILVKIYSAKDLKLNLFTSADLKKILLIFAGLVGLYFIMNYVLSGSILPNTYNAKLTYYTPEYRDRTDFIKYEVWNYFKAGSYYVLMIGFLFSVLKLLYDIYTRKYNQNTVYILFIIGLVFVYWLKLPYAARFGRYMMPVIPFFILVSVIGFRDLARLFNRFAESSLFANIVFYIFIGLVLFMGVKDYTDARELYAVESRYIYSRQVKAAYWLRDNTTESDVVGTHDIGAIGYYSNRKIIDLAGLVTPEFSLKINEPDYVNMVTDYMSNNGVTYVAFLREWYRVVNQAPLFSTAATLPSEVMEVYKFDPGKTKILSREVNGLLMKAQMLAGKKEGAQMIVILNRLISMDPNVAPAYYLRAMAYLYLNDMDNYEKNLLKAAEIYPEHMETTYYLGEYYTTIGKYETAMPYLLKYKEKYPDNPKLNNYLKTAEDSLGTKESNISK